MSATMTPQTVSARAPAPLRRPAPRARSLHICAAKKSVGDLTEADLKGKVVFERADLNVPLDKALAITDDTRIRAAIPTLQYLAGKGAKVMLTSHLVRALGARLRAGSAIARGPRLGEQLDWGLRATRPAPADAACCAARAAPRAGRRTSTA